MRRRCSPSTRSRRYRRSTAPHRRCDADRRHRSGPPHDYGSATGTVDLFGPPSTIARGTVNHRHPQDPHTERFVALLNKINREVRRARPFTHFGHLFSAHKARPCRRWLLRHRRLHFLHFTTDRTASWNDTGRAIGSSASHGQKTLHTTRAHRSAKSARLRTSLA